LASAINPISVEALNNMFDCKAYQNMSELTSKHQHSVPGVDSKSRADVEEPGSNRQLI
jgi:hypothetical protein